MLASRKASRSRISRQEGDQELDDGRLNVLVRVRIDRARQFICQLLFFGRHVTLSMRHLMARRAVAAVLIALALLISSLWTSHDTPRDLNRANNLSSDSQTDGGKRHFHTTRYQGKVNISTCTFHKRI
jgi:hypothetical protein